MSNYRRRYKVSSWMALQSGLSVAPKFENPIEQPDDSKRIFSTEDVADPNNDRRRVVANPSAGTPFRQICALQITKGSRRFLGTGWLFGPRSVMTAGHNVFNHELGGWMDEIIVAPSLNGGSPPYGTARVTRASLRTNPLWQSNPNNLDFDFGAIILDRPIGSPPPLGSGVGWFNFRLTNPLIIQQNTLFISGYPLDKGGTRQYVASNRVANISARGLLYDIDTNDGQSGAPIFLNLNGVFTAIGIHTKGFMNGVRLNRGVLINPELHNQMLQWQT